MFIRFGLLRKALLWVSPERASGDYALSGVLQRGSTARVERVCQVFVHGYGTTLEQPTLWRARFVRETTTAEYRGFAIEGLAAGLAVTELTNPFSRAQRSLEFADDHDGRYRWLAHVGVGFASALLGRHPRWRWSKMREDSREFVLDGYGFCRGLFNRNKYVDRQRIPRRVSVTDLMMFDQGLGRLIWIASAADIHRAAETLRTFARERERALWGGVGIACTYTGVCDQAGYEGLKRLAADHHPALARGCAVACYQSVMDRHIPDHGEIAARVFWNASVTEVAERFSSHLTQTEGRSSEDSPLAYVYDQLERDALT